MDQELQKLDKIFESTIDKIVNETAEQLLGDRHLEDDLNRSLAPKVQNTNNASALANQLNKENTVNQQM